MKSLFLLLFLMPLAAWAQDAGKELVFEITEIRVSPDKVPQFEAGVASHNKKYHTEGPSGARVYWVASGPHTGEYRWVMGPGPWASFDNRPNDDAHSNDWQNAVNQHLLPGGATDYIKLDPSLSRFPKDFNVNKLWVSYAKVKNGKMKEAKELMKKYTAVYEKHLPDQTFGVYFNEMPGEDYNMTLVWFFDKYKEIPEDNGAEKYFEEMYGKAKLKKMGKEWEEYVSPMRSEIWEYRSDLSGVSPLVRAAERR